MNEATDAAPLTVCECTADCECVNTPDAVMLAASDCDIVNEATDAAPLTVCDCTADCECVDKPDAVMLAELALDAGYDALTGREAEAEADAAVDDANAAVAADDADGKIVADGVIREHAMLPATQPLPMMRKPRKSVALAPSLAGGVRTSGWLYRYMPASTPPDDKEVLKARREEE